MNGRRLRLALGVLTAGFGLIWGSARAEARTLVFNGQGNDMKVYDVTSCADDAAACPRRVLIPHAGPTSPGEDMNAQICFEPRDDGKIRFIAGEDSNQGPDDPQGWGYFELSTDAGTGLDDLEWTQLAKLVPTYQSSDSNAENYGCGFLSDGRLVLTDVGEQRPGQPGSPEPGDGQLHVWFPGFDAEDPSQTRTDDPDWDKVDIVGESSPERYCKVAVDIPTAGGVWIDSEDRVYVASNRPQEEGFWFAVGPDPAAWLPGVYRFSNLPRSIDDCETDEGGIFHAKVVERELVVPVNPLTLTASAVTGSGRTLPGDDRETFYVSSVINGTIAEYTQDGVLVQRILGPGLPFGLGAEGFPTPFGVGVDPVDGTLYYADLGVVVSEGDLANPGDHTGTVGRVRFGPGGVPMPLEILEAGLPFPDGIGVVRID